MLSKQTYGAYLLAATIALAAAGRRRRAVAVGAGSILAVVVLLAGWTWLGEPNIVADMLGEGRTVWDRAEWLRTLTRLGRLGPEMPVLALVGVALWNSGGRRETDLTVLAVTMLAAGLVTIGKLGADLNYFLGLRNVAALAAGTLWGIAFQPKAHLRPRLAGAAVLITALIVPSLRQAAAEADTARYSALMFQTPRGRSYLAVYNQLYRMAHDPSRHLLTDSGMIDVRHGERTLFGDPMRLKTLTDSGQLRPTRLEALIAARSYELIVTKRDLFSKDYCSDIFSFPQPVAEQARRHYKPVGTRAELFFYVPRKAPSESAAHASRTDESEAIREVCFRGYPESPVFAPKGRQ